MQRILLLVVAFAIAAVPGFAAGAVIVAPATTTTASVGTTSTKTTTTTATTSTVSTASVAATGNGAPSGSHYNLNIIGVPKDKTADMTGNDGHRIFVQLYGGESVVSLNGKPLTDKVNKIFLQPAPLGGSFLVLDANATDSNGALFQLPGDVSTTTYTVWARALGKPGGKANMTTCGTVTVLDPLTGLPVIDPATGLPVQEVLCSLATLKLERTKNAKFMNVTNYLLSLNVDLTANLTLTSCLLNGGTTTATTMQVSLFNSCFQSVFWNYDNTGLHLLQLRFYQV